MTKRDSDGNPIDGRKTTRGSGISSPYNPQRDGVSVDWGAVDAGSMFDCVDRVTRNGDAIIFGRSSDGGVLVITVCAGSERIKFYGRSGEEMDAHMEGITQALDARAGRI